MRTVMLWRRRTTTLTFLQISVHEAVQRPMLCTCGHRTHAVQVLVSFTEAQKLCKLCCRAHKHHKTENAVKQKAAHAV